MPDKQDRLTFVDHLMHDLVRFSESYARGERETPHLFAPQLTPSDWWLEFMRFSGNHSDHQDAVTDYWGR